MVPMVPSDASGRNYPERVSGTELVNPDFVTLPRPMVFTVSASKILQIRGCFARACASKTGAVLDLIVSTEGITPRQTINDLRQASR